MRDTSDLTDEEARLVHELDSIKAEIDAKVEDLRQTIQKHASSQTQPDEVHQARAV